MQKRLHYCRVKFSPEAIQKAWKTIDPYLSDNDRKHISVVSLEVKYEKEEWEHDSESEFFADYRSVFQSAAPSCAVPGDTSPSEKSPVIFIGHGNSPQWRDLKDHLHEKHGYPVEAYEIGARAGHTIRDILQDMLKKSSFAILVMTGEDIDASGRAHPRDNVIHELGLFQGELGFTRAIVLLEEGTEEFSNIHGIHQVRYSKNNIKETYGEVLASLRREFTKDA